MEKQVICINWGTKYGANYINRLYGMVARNITPPFSFTCFTDSQEGIRDEVQCLDLPPLPAEMPSDSPGKWRKSCLWGPRLGDLEGPVLFLDLDVVIISSLDPFFEFGDAEDTVLAWNIAKPLRRLGQTSVYRFKVGNLVALQKLYAQDPEGVPAQYRYEQHFVTRNAPGGVKLWPWRWVTHFRIQCIPPFPLNFIRPPRPPKGTRIVIFAGSTHQPPDAAAGKSRAKETLRTPLEFIRHNIRKKRGLRRLSSYALPAPWVDKAWRP